MPSSTIPVFDPASPQTEAIRSLFIMVLVISAVIFAIMATLIVLALVRFRARGSQLPVQDHGSERRELFWMLGPILVVVWLAAITTKLVFAINTHSVADAPGGDPARIQVIGHQWWWEARYPAEAWKAQLADAGAPAATTTEDGRSAEFLVANEIHIPVGTAIRVSVDSADVIHSFWVPQLARKIDAIPGRTNHIWLQADRAGTYQGYCAEFCGTQHAWMRFLVIAHEPEGFNRWIATQAIPAADPATALASKGAELFRTMSCVDCHAFGSVGTRHAIGPDLTEVSRRSTLGAGVMLNSPAQLRRWLENPQAIKPGSKMPNFRLTTDQIDALIAYFDQGAPPAPAALGAQQGSSEGVQ
jgi:cytochrome c oxidase subunit 2